MKIKELIRIILGLFFIATAILKIISIEEFEIYLYSFQILNFLLSSIFARLLIIFELVLGTLFILKLFYKQTWLLIFISYISFTLFLIYIAIFRNDSNCHCMGDIVELNPIESIIKNIITIGLLLYIRKLNTKEYKYKKSLVISVILTPIIAVNCVIPTDNIYNLIYADTSNINLDEFNKSLKDTLLLNKASIVHNYQELTSKDFIIQKESLNIIDDEPMLIGVLSSSCKYCILSMKKINLIFENNKLDKSKFIIFIWSDMENLKDFIIETDAYAYEYRIISPLTAINLSYGEFPTFAMMKNGEIISTLSSVNINEKELIEFLTN